MQRHRKHFGPYAVLGQIGSGGMGTIYRAVDTRLGREVALKVLHRDLDVSGARERFVNEARLVSSLNHPNICTLFDMGEQEEDLYLVMEMLHGQSLKERIAAGPVSMDEMRSVAVDVAKALEAAHARSIVHRDIKPANIFLLSDNEARLHTKVLDFGLAKHSNGSKRLRPHGITRHGATVGTVEYMSPEQACGYDTDARSDLFSLGAVLYEMATGKAPFRGSTSAVIYSELLNSDPLPARDANLNLTPDLDRLIQRLLQKAPGDRIQTASELIQEFALSCSEESRCSGRSHLPYIPVQTMAAKKARIEAPFDHPAPLYDNGFTRAEARRQPGSRRTVLRGALLCVLLILLAATVRIAWAGKNPAAFHGVLQIRPLFNGTGNAALDDAPTELLKRELSLFGNYAVQTSATDNAATQPMEPERSVTEKHEDPSSDALLSGSILSMKNGYSVHVEVASMVTGHRLAEADETAPSLEQVPAAVSRAAIGLREALKEYR